jgi:hypothetical protein
MEEFYAQVSGLSFTLLGLWFAVVQLTHQRWLRHPTYRRVVMHQSLYYLIPGLFSLAALVSVDQPVVWQAGFTITAALGGAEAVHFIARSGRLGDTPLRRALRTPRWAPPVYLLVALVAVFPGLPRVLGLLLTPLQVEAILVVVLLLLGLRGTWLVFTELAADQPAT